MCMYPGALEIVEQLLAAAEGGEDDEDLVSRRKKIMGKDGSSLPTTTRKFVEKETKTFMDGYCRPMDVYAAR